MVAYSRVEDSLGGYNTRRAARAAEAARRGHARDTRSGALRWLLYLSPVILVAAWVLFRFSVLGFAMLDVKSQVGVLEDQVTSLDTDQLPGTAARITRDTDVAVAAANDPIVRALERVPVLGGSETLLRQLTEATQSLATTVVAPAAQQLSAIDPQTLRTADGGIDLDQLKPLVEATPQLVSSYDAVTTQVSALDTSAALPPMVSVWRTFNGLLTGQQGNLHLANRMLPLVTNSLGANGPRHYLLVFPNMAETTAVGGTAAAMAELEFDNGRMTIVAQGSSSDFPWRDQKGLGPIMPTDPSVTNLYGDITYERLNLAFSRPDVPTGAKIAQAFWQQYKGGSLDGVIVFDPKALADMLGATGPVKLSTGQTLTKENVVAELLNKAYFTYRGKYKSASKNSHYTDVMTGKFFSAATASIFSAFLHNSSNPAAMAKAVVSGVKTDDIKLWFSNPDEQKQLDGTQIQGVLPTDNAKKTVTGVFFRDQSGGKMDAYLKTAATLKANTCTAGASNYVVDVRLRSTLSMAQFRKLPAYIAPKGGESFTTTMVYIYAPVGATAESVSVTVAGKRISQDEIQITQDLGRTVVAFPTRIDPGHTAKAQVSFTGASGTLGRPTLQVPPMYHSTATKVSQAACTTSPSQGK